MYAIFSPRRRLKTEQTTCEKSVMLFDALLGVSQCGRDSTSLYGLVEKSREKSPPNELLLNACLQADVGDFMKPSEIKVT